MFPIIKIRVKRELFSFSCEQDWVNKAQSRYANCGVRKERYITVDAHGNVIVLPPKLGGLRHDRLSTTPNARNGRELTIKI